MARLIDTHPHLLLTDEQVQQAKRDIDAIPVCVGYDPAGGVDSTTVALRNIRHGDVLSFEGFPGKFTVTKDFMDGKPVEMIHENGSRAMIVRVPDAV